ncbi:hypothetical protein Tco_0682499, partial [Tanacetum coccineum]
FEIASKQSNDPPLSSSYTLRSGEDNMKLLELMELYTKLSNLIKTVNRERQIQALVAKKKVIITKSSIRSDLHLEDADGTDCLPTATIFEELKKQSRRKQKKTAALPHPSDSTADIPNEESVPTHSNDLLLSVCAKNDMIKKDQDVIPKEVSTAAPSTTAVSPPIITEVEITLAQTLAKLKSAKSKVVIQEPFSTSTPQLHLQNFQSKRHYIFRDAVKEQQELQHHAMKNNGIKLLVMKKWLERNPFEAQIQAELIEEERLARKKEEEANIALIESWDNTQAMMEADFELAQRLQEEE